MQYSSVSTAIGPEKRRRRAYLCFISSRVSRRSPMSCRAHGFPAAWATRSDRKWSRNQSTVLLPGPDTRNAFARPVFAASIDIADTRHSA